MFRSLMWKEFREHFWMMAALTGCYLLPMLFAWLNWADASLFAAPVILGLTWVAPVWIAAWTVAGEKSPGSLNTYMAMPIAPMGILASKTAMGLITILVPSLVAVIAAHLLLQNYPQLIDTRVWLPLPVASASLYLLIVATAMGCKREGTAVTIWLLTMFGCWMWIGLVSLISPEMHDFRWLLFPNPYFILIAMAGWRTIQEASIAHMSTTFAIHLFFGLLIWLVALWRFEHRGGNLATIRQSQPAEATAKISYISSEKPVLSPLAWKEWREQGVAVGFAGGLAIWIPTIIIVISAFGGAISWAEMVSITVIICGATSCLAAIVLGVGPLATDLEKHLLDFWKSQPISLRRWFWTKYAVGLAGVAALPAGFFILAIAATSIFQFFSVQGDELLRQALRVSIWRLFLGGLIILPAIYSLSMFLMTIVRQPLLAAILALLMVIFSVMVFLGPVLAIGPIDGRFAICACLTVLGTCFLAMLSRFVLSLGWEAA
jgi:hypothetical protein